MAKISMSGITSEAGSHEKNNPLPSIEAILDLLHTKERTEWASNQAAVAANSAACALQQAVRNIDPGIYRGPNGELIEVGVRYADGATYGYGQLGQFGTSGPRVVRLLKPKSELRRG